jgi:hypothetical protein
VVCFASPHPVAAQAALPAFMSTDSVIQSSVINISTQTKSMSEIQNISSRQPGNGYGITSMVLGILCAVILGWLFAIIGIVFGILSLNTEGRNYGIAGLVLCSIMFPIRVVQWLIIQSAIWL